MLQWLQWLHRHVRRSQASLSQSPKMVLLPVVVEEVIEAWDVEKEGSSSSMEPPLVLLATVVAQTSSIWS